MTRGFDPRTRALRWGLFLLALAGVLVVTGPQAVASIQSWFLQEHDALPWIATRIFGLLSYLALTVSVAYGLLLSTEILDAVTHRAVSFTLHQDLAAMGIGLGMVHGALLSLDATMPYSPVELLVPFAGPYRPIWVGVGQVALYLMVVIYASFSARRRIGQRAWRMLHSLTLLAFVGATAHGLMSGSDTGLTWAFLGYLLCAAIVAFLVAYRIVLSLTRPGRLGGPSRRSVTPVEVDMRA
jgi:methionine sulfoxide reductase heme-binding subunit